MNVRRIWTRWMSMTVALMIALIPLGIIHEVQAATRTFTDTQSHWAKAYIEWGVEHGITAGYEDGTFRPNVPVKEREFLAMVFRANPDMEVSAPAAGEAWYDPYYTTALSLNYPVSDKLAEYDYTRGQVARVIAATQGQHLSTNAAIQYLLDHGLSKGKTSATIEGYAAGDTLTRAEALTFIYNVVHAGDEPDAETAAADFTLNGIAIGDTEAQVIAKLGQPSRKDITDRSYTWYIYNQDYAQYAQIGIADGKAVALYSNAGGWKSASGVVAGASKAKVVEHAAVSASTIDDETYTYSDSGLSITVYLDKHQSDQVDAILIEHSSVTKVDQLANSDSRSKLIAAYEREVFDLTNAFRVKRGLSALAWHDLVASAARGHSADMAVKGYFDHTNLSGLEPWDRLSAAGVPAYRTAGENIAAGQRNAIEAHHGWLNSEGHRKNMLSDRFTMLGVGVAYDADSEYDWYYTQKFYTPLD